MPIRCCLTVLLIVICAPRTWADATSQPAAASKPQPVKMEKGKPLVHVYSGFELPASVGAFRRSVAYTFDDAGSNLSVGYADPALKIIMTVYVYQHLKVPMDQHFKQIKSDVEQVNKTAKLKQEGSVTIRQGKRMLEGMHARYELIGALGGVEQDLVSEAYLFISGRHFVKYRLTYPAADAKAAAIRTEFFINELKFPDPPATKPAK